MNDDIQSEETLISNVRREYARLWGDIATDLSHQIQSPLQHAENRIEKLLIGAQGSVALELKVIRALCQKVSRVVRSSLPLAFVETGHAYLRLDQICESQVHRSLQEVAETIRLTQDAKRGIRFSVEHDSRDIQSCPRVNLEYFEHAIFNVVDNAAKFSFRNSIVILRTKQSKDGGLLIEVSNHGLQISVEEAPKCALRCWRGEAGLMTGTGTGIGLWVVDQIMQAHSGKLKITPTDENGETLVSLVFPTEAEHSQ